MIRRIFPHPVLTLVLIVIWQMLVNQVTLGNLVLGLVLGTAIPLITTAYWTVRPRLHNPRMIVEFVAVVLWDIVMANISVAITILTKPNRDIKSCWVSVPLDLRSPTAITVLAGTITITPGTVSADLSEDGQSLLVHCLDSDDPAAVRDDIKARYERRLKEIFE
ncbi:MAG: Na+/H+ antiporter subunit E [Paracoccaceae bacterium]